MLDRKCCKCKKILTIESFYKDKSRKSGLSNKCKQCHTEYLREHPKKYDEKSKLRIYRWREKNKAHSRDIINKIVSRHRTKKREWLEQLKHSLCCCICGFNNPVCLDFHHIYDDKTGDIGNLINRISLDKIKIELQKCVVLCKNCHARVHWDNLECPKTSLTIEQLSFS